MTDDIVCWRCGAPIAQDVFPIRREEVCAACDADLHVCKLCTFYNSRLSDGCDEPIAGHVSIKDRANFCDYFKPRPSAQQQKDAHAQATTKSQLDALFGGASSPPSSAEPDQNREQLDRLFGLDDE